MIKVTRFNRELVVLNAELIESVEATPDTVITLTSGRKLLVAESVELVVERILEYRRAIHHSPVAASTEV